MHRFYAIKECLIGEVLDNALQCDYSQVTRHEVTRISILKLGYAITVEGGHWNRCFGDGQCPSWFCKRVLVRLETLLAQPASLVEKTNGEDK